MIWGLPKKTNRDIPGEPMMYEHETGSFLIRIRSDSESAGNIAKMTGLLRRVRHLELRVAFLQENVESGRTVVEYLPGNRNGADVFTKVPDKAHLPFFHEDCGLCFQRK